MRLGIGLGLFKAGLISAGVRIFSAFQTRVIGDGGTVEAGTCVVNGINGSALLQKASLLLIPSGYKSGKAYAEIPTNGNGDLTWTRGGTANRTNASGNIELMGTGVPRLSYMYGSCPAVLLEPQRTNLALYSEQFNDSYWAKTGSSITANSTTSPDGTTTADTLIENTATSDHKTFKVFSVTASTTYTLSIYAKKNGRNLVYIFDAYTFRGTIFNLDTLATNNLGAGLINPSIVNVGNGWYRLSGSITPSGINMSFEVGVTNSTSSISYTGDGVSGAFIWGAQLEVGAYPTTYIPTTTATATRVADTFSRNNIYTNGLISASGGTWFVELRGNVNYIRDGYSQGLLVADNTMSGGVSGNGLQIRLPATTSQRLSIQKVISGTNTQLYLTTTDTTKIAIKWNGTTADVFANGVKVVSATAFTPTNMEFLIGSGSDVPKFIQSMALFPTPLSDTDCTTITTL